MSSPPTGPLRPRSMTALPRPYGKNGWPRPSGAAAIGPGVSAGTDRERTVRGRLRRYPPWRYESFARDHFAWRRIT